MRKLKNEKTACKDEITYGNGNRLRGQDGRLDLETV